MMYVCHVNCMKKISIEPIFFCILVDHVVQSLFESSTILDSNIEHVKQLVEWMEDKTFRWKLCYRASVDGWKAEDFHKKCGDVGPTVTLVKCGTNVFGGYTDRGWKKTPGSFSSLLFIQSIIV